MLTIADARHPPAARRSDRALLSLHDLLGEMRRRPTRFELVCWEFNVDEPRARPAWDLARRMRLFEAVGVDRLTGTELFAINDRGRRALRQLNGRRRAQNGTELRRA